MNRRYLPKRYLESEGKINQLLSPISLTLTWPPLGLTWNFCSENERINFSHGTKSGGKGEKGA